MEYTYSFHQSYYKGNTLLPENPELSVIDQRNAEIRPFYTGLNQQLTDPGQP